MLRFNYESELVLDASLDSSRQELSQNQKKRLQQQVITTKSHFTLKISLKKDIKFSRNSIGWLTQKTLECAM